MAPTPKKRRILASSEKIKKSSSVLKKRRKIKNDDSTEKSESKTKFKSSSGTGSVETIRKTLFSDNNSVKGRTDSKRSSSKKTQCQSKANQAVQESSASVDEMDVQQLLALGERSNADLTSCNADDDFEVSTDSESDFEEVENLEVKEPTIPKEGVNIMLDVPDVCGKRKKKGFDLAAHLKRQMNRVRKDLQLLMHKVHVLCWIAHLKFVNNTLNSPVIMETCVALVKSKNLYPSKYADLTYLEGIMKWYHKNVELKKDVIDPLCTGGLLNEIKYQIEKKQALTSKAFIFIFIALLRILGLKARVVMSFQVLPVKPSLLELYGDVIKARSEKLSKSKPKAEEGQNENSEVAIKSDESKSLKGIKRKSNNDAVDQDTKMKGKKKKDQIEVNSDNEFESEHFRPSLNLRSSKKKRESQTKADGKQSKSVAQMPQSVVNNIKQSVSCVNDENEDEDFTLKSLMKKKAKLKNDGKAGTASEENIRKKEGSDVWAEVYLEAEEKWLCVDVPRQKIHCINEIYSRATHPITYIIACNNDSTLKDVTKRYVPNWHSDTRKRRVDNDWWNETMAHFLPAKTAQDKEEDEDINRQLMDQPLPSSIAEFKDHPMYVLRRHLLKFEAIYPPDAPTLGFVRGEPVYARECVFTLHSREMWYKQARLVRLKEEPYKIVKARPKYDKFTGEIKKDLPLELFGKWQTEDYIPPIATGGKVPRNEYGNVDLFKPCMLPIGTVHLQIPALNKIAKKLDIDCAPATVGFDFHSGGSHPVFDGFVVCEEFKDVLLDAWNKEIDESSKKEEEKKEKRVYGNWKRLIRGLLIREKLKIKYAFGENVIEEEDLKPHARASTSSSK